MPEIFFNNYQCHVESDRIRIMYEFPSEFLIQFLLELPIDDETSLTCFKGLNFIKVKMDLNCCYGCNVEGDIGIKIEDFEEFAWRIKHKKHFYKTNPEIPDD